MKRSFCIISLLLVVSLLAALFPSFLIDTAYAADDAPKYIITSNVEWATEKTDTTKPYLKTGSSFIANETQIDYAKTQALQIENYTSLVGLELDYVEVDGVKIYYSDMAQHTTTPVVFDTSACPNLNGRQVRIRLSKNNP